MERKVFEGNKGKDEGMKVSINTLGGLEKVLKNLIEGGKRNFEIIGKNTLKIVYQNSSLEFYINGKKVKVVKAENPLDLLFHLPEYFPRIRPVEEIRYS